jgi:hypothetical protein
MEEGQNVLSFLLQLNQELAEREAAGKKVIGPGLPSQFGSEKFETDDCITALP